MIKRIRVRNEFDSAQAQHDEYQTECYCSECNEYLGSTNHTYRVAHIGEFDEKIEFCPNCGSPLLI